MINRIKSLGTIIFLNLSAIFQIVHLRKPSYNFSFLYKFRIPLFKQFNISKHFTILDLRRNKGNRLQRKETY